MAEIHKRKKPLAVSPLKASQTMGAALAYLGFNRSMPLMHGSQGCTAFAKVFFVRHFREPIPLQTTAMDQVSSIMGADDNIVEALRVIGEKQKPALIGLCSTGLAETQGCDLNGAVSTFRRCHPEFDGMAVVAANTPDFSGCFETGFALAMRAIIDTLIPQSDHAGRRPRQVNVLCGSFLTPGDLEFIRDSIESFGLRALLIPDLSGSLDGHLPSEDYNPLTSGGLTLEELATAAESRATLVVGESMREVGTLLEQRSGVAAHAFPHLHSLQEVDRWMMKLAELSGRQVPRRWRKQRSRLQDAMLDTHFMLGQLRVAVAADPDLLLALHDLVVAMGAEVVSAVTPAKGPGLERLALPEVHVGDLEDLELDARTRRAELLIGNSHLAETAYRLHLPLLRAGFPQYDQVGGFQRVWCGYGGIQQTLFDIANLKLSQHEAIEPYHSIYARKQDGEPTPRMHTGARI